MLRGLPPRQRTAIVLRYWEDLTDEDAARAMGCTASTVHSAASRGVARLRELTANPDSSRDPGCTANPVIAAGLGVTFASDPGPAQHEGKAVFTGGLIQLTWLPPTKANLALFAISFPRGFAGATG